MNLYYNTYFLFYSLSRSRYRENIYYSFFFLQRSGKLTFINSTRQPGCKNKSGALSPNLGPYRNIHRQMFEG